MPRGDRQLRGTRARPAQVPSPQPPARSSSTDVLQRNSIQDAPARVRPRARSQGPIHPPTTEMKVTQVQSLELVRTVVTACISEIVWRKRVFAGVQFKTCLYDPANPEIDYESFIQGRMGTPSPAQLEEAYFWHILPRDCNDEIEKLLNCLEHGVADALQQKYLSQLQLSFHTIDEAAGPLTAKSLVEAYSLFFDYKDGEDGIDIRASLEPNEISVSKVKEDMCDIVQGVLQQVHNTMVLQKKQRMIPAQLHMSLTLRYNESAPENYQPPKFKVSTQFTPDILDATAPDGNFELETGYHSMSVGMILPTTSAGTQLQSQSTHNPRSNPPRAASDDNRRHTLTPNRSQKTPPRRAASEVSEADTQRTSMTAVRAFREIAQFRDYQSATQDTIILPSDVPSPLPGHTLPNYTEDIFLYVQGFVVRNFSGADRMRVPRSAQPQVACECLVSDDHDNLVTCAICGNSYHAQCYGYVESFPSHLACRTCIKSTFAAKFSTQESSATIEGLKSFYVQRYLMHHLWKNGAINLEALAQVLERTKEQVEAILDEIARRDHSITVSKPHKTKAGARKNVKCIFGEEKLREVYFDPAFGLECLFPSPGEASMGNLESGVGTNNSVREVNSATISQGQASGFHSLWTGQTTMRTSVARSSTQGTPSQRFETPLRSPLREMSSMSELGPSSTPSTLAKKRVAGTYLKPDNTKRRNTNVQCGFTSPWVVRHA